MKKGYHYTSKENWEQIQRDMEITKYRIKQPQFNRYFPTGIDGVWLWKNDPQGASHAGNIMYQVGMKGTPEVVKLEVKYDEKKIVNYCGHEIELHHSGSVQNWEYHSDDQAVVVRDNIPLQNIRVIGTYNTVQRLQ